MSTQNYANSNEEEKNYLEEDFLKCDIGDFPSPKTELKDYDDYVTEVMKSGCNRQIAEYVILEYVKLEEKDTNTKKLLNLREEYLKASNKILTLTKEAISNSKRTEQNSGDKPSKYDFEDEIELVCKIITKNENEDINYERLAKIYLGKYYDELSDKEKKEFDEKRKAYIDKRDAVIEYALRRVRKIVNDESEYKKFYKSYYGKDEPED